MTDTAIRFKDAMTALRERDFARSRAGLEQAAAEGHADALAWVALHDLYGYGAPAELERARATLEQAESQGSAEASYQLALLGWCDRLAPRDPKRIAARLVRAARLDHPGALRALTLAYARRGPGDPAHAQAAEQCLLRAATLFDPVAYYLLALLCSINPDAGKRAAAPQLMAMAAQLGVQRAKGRVAPGTPPGRIDGAAPGDLPEPDFSPATPVPAQVHHRDPLLETIDNFFSPLECEYLIAWSEPFQRPSVVVAQDGALVPHPDRTSNDAPLVGIREDFAARMLQARMMDQLGVPLARAEHLTVLRYATGDEYRPHVDYLSKGASGNLPEASQPGQRVDTIFAYLDQVEAGGETEFPRLGKRIKPARGRIVHFQNCRADMSPDHATVHAGLPVRQGAKWLATIWTRERDYRPY